MGLTACKWKIDHLQRLGGTPSINIGSPTTNGGGTFIRGQFTAVCSNPERIPVHSILVVLRDILSGSLQRSRR